MKKTRKLIMVLLALTVAVSLCACGGGNGEKVQKEASGNEISGNSPTVPLTEKMTSIFSTMN